jgi:hypothetical protein
VCLLSAIYYSAFKFSDGVLLYLLDMPFARLSKAEADGLGDVLIRLMHDLPCQCIITALGDDDIPRSLGEYVERLQALAPLFAILQQQ